MLEKALDDRFIISEDIQKMYKEETEVAAEKRRILEMEKKAS